MNISTILLDHFRARISVIHLVGYDEAHILRELTEATKSADWPQGMGLYAWDIADKFTALVPGVQPFDTKQDAPTLPAVFNALANHKGAATFVLKDAHMLWSGDARLTLTRRLRNFAQQWPSSNPPKNLILLVPDWGTADGRGPFALPPELKHDVVSLECPKPDKETIGACLRRVSGGTSALQGTRPELVDKIGEAALGLSEVQAERVFRRAIVRSRGRLDENCLDTIQEAKRAIIRESGALELYPFIESQENVGGLEVLKTWLHQRREAFSEEARDYGLDLPAGLMLVGIPGTGKSLCARVTAGMWKLPLLRLDMGAVFGGVLGSSEKNIREAIAISELIAPCILWVDEIEKAFAGSTGDSGTASRVLGTFLTWMAEKKHPVFVFATANDMFRLPPEFARKGRFDEVFFLDLPTEDERKAILNVHLRKRNYEMAGQRFDLAGLARATEGFVGAELEAVVKEAMFPAFMDGRRELESADLTKAAGQMVPLAKSHAQHIANLRSLVADGLARNASKAKDAEAVAVDKIRGGRLLDL
jgi:hypothetical protein